MTNDLLTERRKLLKKRYILSFWQLFAIFIITIYNCVAELLFGNLVIPVSFYLPQFIASYVKSVLNIQSTWVIVILAVLTALIILAIITSLVLSLKYYKSAIFLTVIISLDIIMLIYFGIIGFLTSGFKFFFVINLLAHIWIFHLSVTLKRSAEGLEVLPESI